MTAKEGAPRRAPFTPLDQVTALFLAAAVLLVLAPGAATLARLTQARREAAQCQENIRQIADALDRYGRVHRDRYPSTLDGLVPLYLETVPTCPTAGSRYVYLYNRAAVNITVYCRGLNHEDAGLGHNRPAWSLARGFLK